MPRGPRGRARACRRRPASAWSSWRATCKPLIALAAPGPRVTNKTPGSPVILPQASAIMEAPPSWRQMMVLMRLESCRPSSAARKLSPGTVNAVVAPWASSWSIRILPPCRMLGLLCVAGVRPARRAAVRCGEARGLTPSLRQRDAGRRCLLAVAASRRRCRLGRAARWSHGRRQEDADEAHGRPWPGRMHACMLTILGFASGEVGRHHHAAVLGGHQHAADG